MRNTNTNTNTDANIVIATVRLITEDTCAFPMQRSLVGLDAFQRATGPAHRLARIGWTIAFQGCGELQSSAEYLEAAIAVMGK